MECLGLIAAIPTLVKRQHNVPYMQKETTERTCSKAKSLTMGALSLASNRGRGMHGLYRYEGGHESDLKLPTLLVLGLSSLLLLLF